MIYASQINHKSQIINHNMDKEIFLNVLKERILILDGGMGTMVQGFKLTEKDYRGKQFADWTSDLKGNNDLLCITRPDVIKSIHRQYLDAGADIFTTNTFNANAISMEDYGMQGQVRNINLAAGKLAREVADDFMKEHPDRTIFVAGSVGPTNKTASMSPDVSDPAYRAVTYLDLYSAYKEQVDALVDGGVDIVLFETTFDTLNVKAGLEAAETVLKEKGKDLPIMLSLTLSAQGGRTFSGQTLLAFLASVQHTNIVSVGLNCSFGAADMKPFLVELAKHAPYYISAYPNAGLPNPDGSYNLDPDEFAAEMKEYAAIGVSMVGGCCGTTPAFIARLHETFSPLTPADKIPIRRSCLCTPVRFVEVDGITVVGERINPTGKKRLQQALRDGDSAYPCTQAVAQAEAGAQVLDVNAGLPGIDEAATLEQLVKDLQAVTDLPLQLDSSNPEALSRALRIYNGKPIVNSVNGEPETLEKILPLCKKYGAAVVGLALDKDGIPPTAEGRFAIAQRIVAAANAAGIPNEDIYIDCLTLTASAQQEGAVQTLEALSRCKRELGVRTVLGVSNISFGLPCRGYLNTTFLAMAMSAGLDLAIMNPNTPEMMAAVRAYRVLTSQDLQSTDYVAAYADVQIQTTQMSKSAATVAEVGAAAPGGDALFEAVRRGLKAEARAAADAALTMREPLDVVNASLIPALDAVGDGFEKGTVFLPQLLQAATAAQAAFEAIKAKIAASGQAQGSKGKIVIATVKGDVHDIGKNIVRVILENYGYDVLDLGRDVDPERVVEAVRQTGAKLVGLSALMTTTVPNMQATIEALHAAHLDCKVMVGGAVLTPDYARDIGADYYCKDAKASADLAKQLLD